MRIDTILLIALFVLIIFMIIRQNKCSVIDTYDSGGYGVVSALNFYNNDAVYRPATDTNPNSPGYVIPHHLVL